MKVRMLVGMANAQQRYSKGGVYDLPDAEAVSLCNAGFAEAVAEKKSETRKTATTGQKRQKRDA